MILDFTQLHTIPHDGTIGYIRGTFDILHSGHIHFIEFAKQQVDVLVVGVVSDQTVKRRKGTFRPINSEEDRLRVIGALKDVDYCFVIPSVAQHSTELVLETLKPFALIQHRDNDEEIIAFRKVAKRYGIHFIVDESKRVQSTTNIINTIRKQ